MFCENCGAENVDEAVFCQECGSKLETQENADQLDESVISDSNPKGNRKKQIIGGAVILTTVLVGIVVLGLYFNGQKNADFEEKLLVADQYMQAMDYEKAEASYLEAIRINPKDENAYRKLSDLYMKQGRKEEAIDILEKGSKATGSKKIKQDLSDIKTGEVQSGSAKRSSAKSAEKKIASQVGLADVGTFSDDERNQLGLISSWRMDINGDGAEEIITTSSESHGRMDMKITLYEMKDGKAVQLDELVPEEQTGSENVKSYGDSTCDVFVKKKGDQYYLVIDNTGMSQSYSASHSKFAVYEINRKFAEKSVIETDYYRGDNDILLNGKSMLKILDEEAVESDEREQKMNETMKTLKADLKPYGLDAKVTYSSESIEQSILMNGFNETDKTETHISNRQRRQTGESIGDQPEMEVIVADFTKLRDRVGDKKTTEENQELQLKSTGLTDCLGMTREEIEETYGALIVQDQNEQMTTYTTDADETLTFTFLYDRCCTISGKVKDFYSVPDERMTIEVFGKGIDVNLEAIDADGGSLEQPYGGELDPEKMRFIRVYPQFQGETAYVHSTDAMDVSHTID